MLSSAPWTDLKIGTTYTKTRAGSMAFATPRFVFTRGVFNLSFLSTSEKRARTYTTGTMESSDMKSSLTTQKQYQQQVKEGRTSIEESRDEKGNNTVPQEQVTSANQYS